MKKILLITALVAVMTTGANAQNKNAIKLNPLSLIFATGNVAYERALSSNTSIQLGMFFSGFSIGDFKYSGLGITPEFRFYFAGHKQALNGVYVGPFLRYQNFTIKEKDDTEYQASFSSFGGGAVIGWEKSWSSGFVLDLFVGPSFNSGTVKSKNGSDPDDFNLSSGVDGFTLRTGITLGFSF